MGTLQLLADGVGGKFNVFMAKKTGHFQVSRLLQGDAGLAMRTRNFLVELLTKKLDVPATRRADHL